MNIPIKQEKSKALLNDNKVSWRVLAQSSSKPARDKISYEFARNLNVLPISLIEYQDESELIIAIPNEPPNCRIIPVKAAPSPICFPFNVESESVVIGTKSNPKPTPLKIKGQNICSTPVSGVMRLRIIKVKKKKIKKGR